MTGLDRHRFAKDRELSRDAYALLAACSMGDEFDSGDLWGTLMTYGFDACDEATRRQMTVPDELDYRPAPGGPFTWDVEDGGEEVHYATDEDLARFLTGLDPLLERCKATGLDY